MKKCLRKAFLSVVLVVVSFTILFYPFEKIFASWGVFVRSSEEVRIRTGNWSRVEPPIYVPEVTYPTGSLVKYGLSCYYRTGAATQNAPTVDTSGWAYVPNYDEIVGAAQWDENINYPSSPSQASGVIVEYEGSFYQRLTGSLTKATTNPVTYVPPPLDPLAYSWDRILTWDDTQDPIAWSSGAYKAVRIFYLMNGDEKVYYALITNCEPSTAGPNPDSDGQYYRRIEEWSASQTYRNQVNKFAGQTLGGGFWPYSLQATDVFFCRTMGENGHWEFWQLRAPQSVVSVTGTEHVPGESPYWVQFEFACTDRIVVTGDGAIKKVWDRNSTTETLVSPLDEGQTVWQQRSFVSTSSKYVWTIVDNEVVLWQNPAGGNTSSVPGTQGSVWQQVQYTFVQG